MSDNRTKAMIIAIMLLAGTAMAQLFREQASATSSSTYSSRCFSINGKPTWIFAGEVEYWRVPRELWRDRLMRVKRAGYNVVSFYVAWNLHEPVRNEWHFEDNLDLDAWLALIKELGLYAIPRVGPYICAEVDFGGLPPWLVDIPNVKLRGAEAQYLTCVDTMYAHIFPIVTKHQITSGGMVICVQLENEYYPGNAAYQSHLVNKAKALGMVVPYIWSSCYNGTEYDPGLFPNLSTDTKGFMTEQWMGWISRYGEPSANDANTYNRQTWKMVAAGTAGTSHYMAHGGTNFGYTAALDQRVTSYDYGSQIGELGQLRPVYMTVKQTGWLINTFSPLVTNSTNGSAEINSLPAGLTSWAHTGTGGKAAFAMNGGTGTTTFQMTWKNKGITVPTVGSWSLEAAKFAHFLADVPITANTTLDYSATGILCLKKLGTKNYLVLYATPGNSGGDIAFVYKTAPASAPVSPWSWNATAKRASLRFTYPTTDTVNEVVIDDGAGQTINLLIISNGTSNKTWVTDSSIVSGAEYVDENENLQFPAAGGRAFVFSRTGMQIVTKEATTAQSAKSFSSGWSWIATPEAGASYNDAAWKQSTAAQDMTSYGWPNGYGWYRSTYTAASAGSGTLAIPNVSGSVVVFVNGTWAGNSASQSITLKQGANSIAILAVGAMRDKMWNNFDFTPPNSTRTGIWGTITIGGASVGPWRFRGGFEGVNESPMMGTIAAASWTALLARIWSTGAPPSDNVPRLWRMDFAYTPPVNALQTWTLSATVNAGTQGVVWINGHCLGRQITNQPALFVPQCWLNATNTVVLLTQGGGAPQGYALTPVEYRSFAKSPLTGVSRTGNSLTSVAKKVTGNMRLVATGDRLTLPPGFAGKEGSMAIFDLRGHLLIGNVAIRNGVPVMPLGKVLPRGVYMARSEK